MNRLLLVAIALSALPMNAQSEPPSEFRVVTKIFLEDQIEPAAEHVTLFDSGVAYDLPQLHDRFVTVCDPANQRVTLLDRLTQVQTTISTKDLTKITAQARAAAKTPEQQAHLGLLATATVDPETQLHEIRFANIAYAISTQSPTQKSISSDYGVYFDLAARLNLVRRLGPPPFARMTLNLQLVESGQLPRETTLTITRNDGIERFRSTLDLTETLSSDDRTKIDEIRGMLELYRDVPLKQFPSSV